jgi:AraC-like DNA-binding protein
VGVLGGSWLVRGSGFSVADVRCPGRCQGFDVAEEQGAHVLVAARRGAFLRRAEGTEVLVDSTVAYLGAPGTVQQFAHPVPGGDSCTAVHFEPSFISALLGGDPFVTVPALPMDAATEVALRRLARAACSGGPDDALVEHVVRLTATLLERRLPGRVGSGRPATSRARWRLVERAKEEMLADPGAGLVEVAGRVGYSPHHLSRVFSQLTGQSVTSYRNRLRVGRALDRIADGETSLARLSAELGFADHAHLTRTFRTVTGYSPSGWRAATRPPA